MCTVIQLISSINEKFHKGDNVKGPLQLQACFNYKSGTLSCNRMMLYAYALYSTILHVKYRAAAYDVVWVVCIATENKLFSSVVTVLVIIIG